MPPRPATNATGALPLRPEARAKQVVPRSGHNDAPARSGCRYGPDFTDAEDYDFWERAARLTRFGNLPEALVCYRLHPRQVTNIHRAAQVERSRAIRLRQLVALGLEPTAEELAVHEDLVVDGCGRTRERFETGRR